MPRPTTRGTSTGSPLPFETWSATAEPSSRVVPPPGAWAITVFFCLLELTFSTIGVKLASTSMVWASSEDSPMTSGTSPVSGGGGASNPSTGMPAIAFTMNAFQIGAASVPPKTESP